MLAEPSDERSLSEDHADRAIGHVQRQKEVVDRAMRAQEDRPGEGFGDDADRERKEQGSEKDAAQRAPGKRQPERRGVADDEGDRGGDEPEAQRIPDQRAAERLAENPFIGLDAEALRANEAAGDEMRKRNGVEGNEDQRRGRRQQQS